MTSEEEGVKKYPQICVQTIQILPAKREMGWENPNIFVDVTYGRSPFFFSPLSVFLILIYATKIRDCARLARAGTAPDFPKFWSDLSTYYIGLVEFPELELPGIDSLWIEKNLNALKRHLKDSDCCMNVSGVDRIGKRKVDLNPEDLQTTEPPKRNFLGCVN